jgi:ribosomal protein L6P/L9E
MKIKFNISIPAKIKVYATLNHNFLVVEYLNSKFFLKLASNISFFKKNNHFSFVSKTFSLNTILQIRSFFQKIKTLEKKEQKFFYKKLLLKGLGFKVLSVVQNEFLELKLGFSHSIKIPIPAEGNLKIYSNKNMIIIEGICKITVGNFANKIKSYRLPDSYKGKGI